MIDELIERLRGVERGELLANEELAGEAADVIILLLGQVDALEEKLRS